MSLDLSLLSHIRNLPIVGELIEERFIVLELKPILNWNGLVVPCVLVYDIEEMDYVTTQGTIWLCADEEVIDGKSRQVYETSFDFRRFEDRIYENE